MVTNVQRDAWKQTAMEQHGDVDAAGDGDENAGRSLDVDKEL